MFGATERLVEAFAQRGHELWLVGGALRDRELGRPHYDRDYATNALPDEVEGLAGQLGLEVVTVGRRYGTIGVLLDGHWSEITTFRGDSYRPGSRWPDVTFGASIDEDLARRDFTVNALAENPRTGAQLDPFGGRADLRERLLRAVGEPELRFREDPLRILRGFRFASQLDFAIEPATLDGMKRTVGLLASLSQERITGELDRLLRGVHPARGLELLRESGAVELVLPELVPMVGCEQNRFHFFDVWRHTVATVQAIGAGKGEDLRLRRWTALLHDLGKPAVRHRKPNGEWGFYRHETAGADLAAPLLARLRLGRRESLAICLLVKRHMDRPDAADRRLVRRFMARCEGHWRDLVALKRADNASHTYDDDPYHDQLEAACQRVQDEDAAALRAESPLSGNDLIAIFDREPGPWIRRVKERLSAMVLDGELAPGDRGAAERVARQLLGRGREPG
jgi:poly(A) polymerase